MTIGMRFVGEIDKYVYLNTVAHKIMKRPEMDPPAAASKQENSQGIQAMLCNIYPCHAPNKEWHSHI